MTTNKIPNRLAKEKSRIYCNTLITRLTGILGVKKLLTIASAKTSLFSYLLDIV